MSTSPFIKKQLVLAKLSQQRPQVSQNSQQSFEFFPKRVAKKCGMCGLYMAENSGQAMYRPKKLSPLMLEATSWCNNFAAVSHPKTVPLMRKDCQNEPQFVQSREPAFHD